jgi:hypothetical protein
MKGVRVPLWQAIPRYVSCIVRTGLPPDHVSRSFAQESDAFVEGITAGRDSGDRMLLIDRGRLP